MSRRRAPARPRPRSVLLAALALCAGTTLAAPAHAQRRHADSALVRAARTVIQGAGHASFITLDATGHPQARIVQPVAPDSAMVVWFATNPRSRKVEQLARDGRATLHYFEPASLAYVTLLGRARVVRDRKEKDAHWNPAWSAYYPDRDTSVVLIQFTPDRLEIVDIKRNVDGDPRTWTPATVHLRRRGASR